MHVTCKVNQNEKMIINIFLCLIRGGNALYFRMVGAKATLYCYKIGVFSPHVLSISVVATYTQPLFLARKGVAMRTFESFTGRHDDRRLAFIKDGVELRAGLPPGPALGQYGRRGCTEPPNIRGLENMYTMISGLIDLEERQKTNRRSSIS